MLSRSKVTVSSAHTQVSNCAAGPRSVYSLNSAWCWRRITSLCLRVMSSFLVQSMLRGRGGCYKHTFYGIESHRCMETTPSLACANKCVFCWRYNCHFLAVQFSRHTCWVWMVTRAGGVLYCFLYCATGITLTLLAQSGAGRWTMPSQYLMELFRTTSTWSNSSEVRCMLHKIIDQGCSLCTGVLSL